MEKAISLTLADQKHLRCFGLSSNLNTHKHTTQHWTHFGKMMNGHEECYLRLSAVSLVLRLTSRISEVVILWCSRIFCSSLCFLPKGKDPVVPGNSNNSTTHLTATRQTNEQLKSLGQPTRTLLSLLDLSASTLLKQAEKQEENSWINDICGSYFRHAPCS